VELGSKDVVALAIIAVLAVLVALGRATIDVILPILSIIVGYYFGYEHGVVVERARERGKQPN